MSDTRPRRFAQIDTPAPHDRGHAWVLWIALVVAMSPLLHDLTRHWISHPWARYSTVFVPLTLWCAFKSPASPARPILGTSLILIAILAQVLASVATVLQAARPALPLALIGMLLAQGRGDLRTNLLALWIVPIPTALARVLQGQPIAMGLSETLARAFEGAVGPLEVGPHHVQAGDVGLSMLPVYGGLATLVHLTGLAYYATARRGLPCDRSLAWLAGAGCIAVPLQAIALAMGLAFLSLGSDGLARQSIETITWLLPAVIVIAWTEHTCHRAERAASVAGDPV